SVAGADTGGDADPAHEFGVEWRGKVGPGSIRATWGATLMPGDEPDGPTTFEDNNFGWRAGITYSQGPWTVAAGYKDAGEWARFDETGDITGFDVGVAYNGGRWEVALVHINTKAADDGGDNKWKHTMLTGAYNFGGGLTGNVALHLFDLDEPLDTDDGGNSGTAIILGLGAKF
ncbi:MAG: porin, partial [Alphaproteobacteria bacterium]|nr:porin [Alphaproteobacteria bacterium]